MKELKVINQSGIKGTSSCCEGGQCGTAAADGAVPKSASAPQGSRAGWVVGTLETKAGSIHQISTDLSRADYWEHIKCRISAFRESYMVAPGLYAVGTPDRDSDVLVSANYKLSFDALRKELKGLNVWILVLDTKGINVWCAAGKGTFGTDELLMRISLTKLADVVDHARIILPQLGAPGISAHKVQKSSGFRVCYGPVRAEDIRAYISAGNKATREMRTVTFSLLDRLILTPMEINPAMKKYYPWYALIMLAVFGLQPGGIFFRDAINGGVPFLLLGLISVLAGAFFTPLLLPFIPFRSFAVKGWITGMLSTFLITKTAVLFSQSNTELLMFTYLFFPLASSYIALQFTGSTTFTGMSGVKKELKIGIPVYLFFTGASVILLAVFKLGQWGVL